MDYIELIIKVIIIYFSILLFSKYVLEDKYKNIMIFIFIMIIIFKNLNIIKLLLSFITILLCDYLNKKSYNNKEEFLILIKNGFINYDNLDLINKDKYWLEKECNDDIDNIKYAIYLNNKVYIKREDK